MNGKPHGSRAARSNTAFWRGALAALALLQAAFATPASALELRRGLNLDIWVEWLPVETMLERPGFLDVFPDWRRHVPIEPGPLLALGPGERRQGLIDQVVATVELLHDTDLAVIVDLHLVSRPGNPHGTEAVLDEPAAYLELVEAVGKALAGLDPARTAFEPINEPDHDCAAVAQGESILWPPLLKRLHATARQAAPELPIVLTGACWGHATGLIALDPGLIDDANVLWTFHSYEPFVFTHQGAEWISAAERYLADVPYPPHRLDDPTLDRLAQAAERRARGTHDVHDFRYRLEAYRNAGTAATRAPIDAVAAWADRHALPRNRLLLGEFGAMRGNDRLAFLEAKRRPAEEHGIPWAIWSWGDAMAITLDRGTRELDPAVCAALGLEGCKKNGKKKKKKKKKKNGENDPPRPPPILWLGAGRRQVRKSGMAARRSSAINAGRVTGSRAAAVPDQALRKRSTTKIWSLDISAGAWPTPGNVASSAFGPRRVISSATA